MASETITLYFYGKSREIAVGDTVTVFKIWHGESVGERAKLTRVAARFAEFTTDSGSRVKVFAHSGALGSTWYLGHKPAKGWEKGGWRVDPDESREIEVRHAEYLAFNNKTLCYEWRDR